VNLGVLRKGQGDRAGAGAADSLARVIDRADVVVIGGGPAGSVLGSLLAQTGHSALILERDIHPRDHVGESFTPSSNAIWERIGFLAKMEEAGFVRRARPENDRRTILIVLTDKGTETLERARRHHRDGIQRHFSQHLTNADIKALTHALEKISTHARPLRPGRIRG